jgi:hypothetical protein
MDPMQFIMQALSGGNIQQSVQQMAQQNPQYAAMLNQMKSSGMTPQNFVLQYAKQSGVDIQPLLNMLRQRGAKF